MDLLEKIDVLYIKIQLKYKLAAAYRWSFNTGGHYTGCNVPRHLHFVRQTWHGLVVSGYWRCTLQYSNNILQIPPHTIT